MNQMRNLVDHLERFPFWSALVIVTIFFGGMLAVVVPIFETTDDSFMKGIVSGTFCVAEASDLMVYTNVLIGRMLRTLYRSFPDVPWYSYYLIGTHFASTVGLLWAFLLVAPQRRTVGYFLLGMTGLGSYFLWHLSFTTSAYLAVQSGVAINVAVFSASRGRAAMIAGCICGSLLIILGSLIRWQMFALTGLLLIPLIVAAFVMRPSWKLAFRAALVVCLTLAAVQALVWYDDNVYRSDPEWEPIRRFNLYSYWVADLAQPWFLETHPSETKAILGKVGWTPNDFRLANNWFFMHPTVYSEAAMREVGSEWLELQSKSRNEMIATVIAMYMIHLWSSWGLMAIVISIACWFQSTSRAAALGSLGSWIVALGIMGGLALTQKVPDRVAIPMLVSAVISTLLLLAITDRSQGDGVKPRFAGFGQCVVVGVIILLLARTVFLGYQHQRALLKMNHEFWVDLDDLAARGDSLIVLWNHFPYDLLLPYDDLRRMDKIPRCVLGAVERTPHTKVQLQKYGIDEVMLAISRADAVSIVGGPVELSLVKLFIKQHFQVDLGFRLVFRARTKFHVYKAIRPTSPLLSQ